MTIEELKIRFEPHNDDLYFIEDIVSSTGFFREDEIMIAVELVRERLHKGLTSGYEFVFADFNEKLVAYSCYGLIPCTLKSFDLYWIVTHNDFRNMGIGRHILGITETIIKSSGGYSIYVETSSLKKYLPTRKFYEHNQYVLKARLDNFYDEVDYKLIYVKSLVKTMKIEVE